MKMIIHYFYQHLFLSGRKIEDRHINPRDRSDMNYWSQQFGISHRILNDAIMATGSLSIREIRRFLIRNNILNTSRNLFKGF